MSSFNYYLGEPVVASPVLAFLQGVIVLLVLTFSIHVARRRFRSRPPGPLGVPILGNLSELQASRDPEYIASIGKKYGEVIYLEAFGLPMVLLNGQAAVDLLDKRGSIYSDRPDFPMAVYSGMGDLLPLMRYGEKFQFGRRLMNKALSTRAVSKWERGITEETYMLLRLLHSDPTNYVAHLNKMAGSIVMMSLYGHRVTSDDDPYVRLALEFMAASTEAIMGRWLVDFLPFARNIPGLPFHHQAAKWRECIPDWIDKAFNSFKENMHHSEDAKRSLCGSLLIRPDGSPPDPEIESQVKWIASSGFGAGLDVLVASICQFIMAMAINPGAQARAQKEIDEVVGRGRLPAFSDRESLSYVECIYKESLRWGTPSPLSVPHRLTTDDVYQGYLLPAGTICIGNVWSCLHDERMYEDPMSFIPERFEGLNTEEAKLVNPEKFAFGFGRRRCPGRNFAHSAMWIAMVCLLSAFVISPDIDEDGNEIEIKVEFIPGAIRHTRPFRVRFTPRHNQVLDLLRTI